MEWQKLRSIGKLVDLSLKIDYVGRSTIGVLWDAVLTVQEEPIALQAAKRLQMALSDRPRYAILVTGTMVRSGFPKVVTETDGPLGAAVLARALWRAFKAVPIFVTLEKTMGVMGAAAQGVGFTSHYCREKEIGTVLGDQRFLKASAAIITSLSPGVEHAIEMTRVMTENDHVGAMISIEMVGRNQFGIAHAVNGTPKDNNLLPWFDKLFEVAKERGLLTLGIGDGGNEIGMGKIKEVLDSKLPSAKCSCPCGGTIVPLQEVDVLVPAVISNWGAYGIALCIATELGRPDVFHDGEMENRLLAAVVSAGAVDGNTNLIEESVDGLTREANASYVHLLRSLLLNHLRSWSLQ